MATEKRKVLRVINEQGETSQVLFETSADQVTVNNTEIDASFKSTDTQSALKEVYTLAKTGGVTGVKGDKETTYRKGNINITPANVGALPDTTKYGTTLDLGYAQDTGIITATLKDQKGNTLSTKTIDLPLEMIVKSGTVETCTKIDTPVKGYKVGDIYIDLVLAKTTEHIYILASDLIDEIVDSQSGTGNVVTSVTANKHTVTITKGITAVTKVNTKSGSEITLTKSDIDLGNVDNTADSTKEVLSSTKLKAARKISISGDVTGDTTTDFSNDNTNISVTLPDKITAQNGMSVFNVDTKGRVVAANKLIEFGTTGQKVPSETLAVGGLFFEKQN